MSSTNTNVPPAVAAYFVNTGSIGGKLSAHKRWGTPLPADVIEYQKAKKKKEAAIKKAKAKLKALQAE